jgi:SNF2 family DNA or RNA helicase
VVQAKGRSVRYGQTKHVHIYHFLSLRTIDVDITQARTGKVLVNKARGKPELPFQKFKPSGFAFIDATGEADVGEFSSPIFGKMDVDLDVD